MNRKGLGDVPPAWEPTLRDLQLPHSGPAGPNQICPRGPSGCTGQGQTPGPQNQDPSFREPQPRQAPEPSRGPCPQVGALFPPDQEEEGPKGKGGVGSPGEESRGNL